MSTAILQWLQIALSSLTLAAMVFGVIKVVNRNNEEWRERERRLQAVEQEVAVMRSEGREIIAIGTQLGELRKEVERVRDRLDTWLDGRAKSQVHD